MTSILSFLYKIFFLYSHAFTVKRISSSISSFSLLILFIIFSYAFKLYSFEFFMSFIHSYKIPSILSIFKVTSSFNFLKFLKASSISFLVTISELSCIFPFFSSIISLSVFIILSILLMRLMPLSLFILGASLLTHFSIPCINSLKLDFL